MVRLLAQSRLLRRDCSMSCVDAKNAGSQRVNGRADWRGLGMSLGFTWSDRRRLINAYPPSVAGSVVVHHAGDDLDLAVDLFGIGCREYHRVGSGRG